jgi:pyruvate formate lyase activating enzyme
MIRAPAGCLAALIPSAELVQRAVAGGCRSIAYTYTEPTVWFEYALETARLAAEAGLYNIFVTNGYISTEALGMIAPVLHAANIDLKGFSNVFYRRVCGAQLNEVLDCIREYRRRGIWIEITTLVIPGENDDAEQLNGIARFIADELGPDTPWHVSRFFPVIRCWIIPLPLSAHLNGHWRLVTGLDSGISMKGMLPVVANRRSVPAVDRAVIGRSGYTVTQLNLKDGACGSCGKPIAGVWG